MHALDPKPWVASDSYFFLGAGTFAGKLLLDSAFVEAATTNRVADLGPQGGYGYGWWTTDHGLFYANGRGGQFIFVAPDRDLVVVSTAGAAPEQVHPSYSC
jgi:CubicO group peptidase (beta-lactamase class C family)